MVFWKHNYNLFLIALVMLTSCDKKDNSQEKLVRDNTKTYEQAFNKKDVKAIANLWAEDAEYVIPESGEVIKGRAAIR